MSKRQQYIESPSPIAGVLTSLFKGNSPSVIMDIGSCEGEDSIRYSRLFPYSRIIAFEPLPDNQKLIKSNLENFAVKNVELIPVALSDENGTADFHVSSGNPEGRPNTEDWNFGNKSSSLLPPDKHLEVVPWVKFDQVIEVPTLTLSDFMINNNIQAVDFMHIDVQGAELKVLKGAGQAIRNIKAIWLEVADVTLYKNQPTTLVIEDFMREHGFYLVKSVRDGNVGDQMYLNKKYFRTISFFSVVKHFQRSAKR